MAWFYIGLAGILEVVWALGLKFSNGFSLLIPSIITLVAIVSSFFLFSKSLKDIPVGTAYAIFTGIGAAGTVIYGMLFLHESVHIVKIILITTLLTGIIGLKLTSDQDAGEEDYQAR
ncbi:multidrug efflux SMR transporter [Ammoniphilus sp. YIM 78166]|uniref:DMT family transporter n=1 Tax=Ammoniphilus sp. YIM 78166 TaxID=1644106 RepID=UPI001070076F|nr:multidrug efflux SMR transporter [Ammoniphilus sp. YIM 78166]